MGLPAIYNLNNSVIRVVTRLENFYIYDVEVEKVEKNSGNGNSSYILKGGFAINILKELSHFLNFRYVIVEDKTLTYRFDQASNQSIDLYAASYSILPKRASVATPTFVIGSSRVQILMDHRFEASLNDYVLLPFDLQVWICLVAAIIFIAMLFTLSAALLDRIQTGDGIFISISIFLSKGLADAENRLTFTAIPSRIIIFISAAFTIILMASYSGKIVSIAAVKLFAIDSYEKLVDSDFDVSFDLGFNNDSVVQNIAESLLLENPIMAKLYAKISKSRFKFDTFDTTIEEIRHRPLAILIDEETAFNAIHSVFGFFPCSWGAHSFAGVKYPWSMFMRKETTIRPSINYGILRLMENGAMRYFEKRWIPRKGAMSCSVVKSKDGNFARISVRQVRTAFVILLIGFAMATILLLIETRRRWRFMAVKVKNWKIGNNAS